MSSILPPFSLTILLFLWSMSRKCFVCCGGYIRTALWQFDLCLWLIVRKAAHTLAAQSPYSLSVQADDEMQQRPIRYTTNSTRTYLQETERHEGNQSIQRYWMLKRKKSNFTAWAFSFCHVPVGGGARFSAPVQTGRGAHPASSTMAIVLRDCI